MGAAGRDGRAILGRRGRRAGLQPVTGLETVLAGSSRGAAVTAAGSARPGDVQLVDLRDFALEHAGDCGKATD